MDKQKVDELVSLLKSMVKHIQAVGEYEGQRLEQGLELKSDSANFAVTISIKNGPSPTARVS